MQLLVIPGYLRLGAFNPTTVRLVGAVLQQGEQGRSGLEQNYEITAILGIGSQFHNVLFNLINCNQAPSRNQRVSSIPREASPTRLEAT